MEPKLIRITFFDEEKGWVEDTLEVDESNVDTMDDEVNTTS